MRTQTHTPLIPFSYTQAWEELPDLENNATLIMTVNAPLLISYPNTPLYYQNISLSVSTAIAEFSQIFFCISEIYLHIM